jgi:hypothetical protein
MATTQKTAIFIPKVNRKINQDIRQKVVIQLRIGKKVIRAAHSVQCLTTYWTTGFRSPTEAEKFSSNICVQTGSGAHPASYTLGIGDSFPRGKAWLGRDADHSPPSSAEIKKEYGLHLSSKRHHGV